MRGDDYLDFWFLQRGDRMIVKEIFSFQDFTQPVFSQAA